MAGFARRRGKDWLAATINGKTARDPKVDLRFLGAGNRTLVSLADNPARPDAFARTERSVRAHGGLRLKAFRPVRAELRGVGNMPTQRS